MATNNANDLPDLTADGQIYIGQNSGIAGAATITAGTGITINNGSNSIEIQASQAYGWEMISSADASGDASLDFENILSTASGDYDTYVFVLNGISPATDDVDLEMVVGYGATPVWITGALYDWYGKSGFANAVDSATGDTQIVLNFDDDGNDQLGSGSGEGGYSAWVWVHYNQFSSGARCFRVEGSYVDEAGDYFAPVGGGVYTLSTKITSIRFLMSSGNIASGNITAYKQVRSV